MLVGGILGPQWAAGGGKGGVENGPAVGGSRIFPAGGGNTFCSRGGVKLQKEP